MGYEFPAIPAPSARKREPEAALHLQLLGARPVPAVPVPIAGTRASGQARAREATRGTSFPAGTQGSGGRRRAEAKGVYKQRGTERRGR